MRLAFLGLVVTATLCVGSKHVVELNPDNFDLLISNGEDWMIDVYAPWCGHCKKLEPHYEKAAAQLDGKVRFGKIDGSKYRSLSMRFGIQGFPTIFHVQGTTGDVRRAAVAHNTESLVHYATKGWTAPAYTPIPFWQSPTGPFKKAVFSGMKLGEKGATCGQPRSRRGAMWFVTRSFSPPALISG